MQRHERDLDLISVILSDCQTVKSRIDYFHATRQSFVEDRSEVGNIAYDAIMSPLYRIAEDALHLSEEVTSACSEYPWNEIRGFRNFVAHGYREVDREIAWKVATVDIPHLEKTLETYIEKIDKHNYKA